MCFHNALLHIFIRYDERLMATYLITGVAGRLSAQTSATARMRIKQSVMASVWTGSTTSFEERCKILARIGFKGVFSGRQLSNTVYSMANTQKLGVF